MTYIRLKQALDEALSAYAIRHEAVIFHHNNARALTVALVKKTALTHMPYIPDLVPYHYNFIWSHKKVFTRIHRTAEQGIRNCFDYILDFEDEWFEWNLEIAKKKRRMTWSFKYYRNKPYIANKYNQFLGYMLIIKPQNSQSKILTYWNQCSESNQFLGCLQFEKHAQSRRRARWIWVRIVDFIYLIIIKWSLN